MTPGISSVRAISSTQLLLDYENGERRSFDITPWLDHGRFRELRDERVFKAVKVSFDTIEWSNGLDIDPEELYSGSAPALGEAEERRVSTGRP